MVLSNDSVIPRKTNRERTAKKTPVMKAIYLSFFVETSKEIIIYIEYQRKEGRKRETGGY
jgi:hypothetical protein